MNPPALIMSLRFFSIISLAITLLAGIGFSKSVLADVVPGAKPKEWPANPAKHLVKIRREAEDKQKFALIASAEALQPSKESVIQASKAADRNDPLGLNQPKEKEKAAGDKVWWYKEQLGIRIPVAITAEAVTYYSSLVSKYGKQNMTRFVEPSSSFDYQAEVKFQKEFKVGDKAFTNVHVVTLKLTFKQSFCASGTEGMHFNKERIVIFDSAGKVLHTLGDGPTEVPIFAI